MSEEPSTAELLALVDNLRALLTRALERIAELSLPPDTGMPVKQPENLK